MSLSFKNYKLASTLLCMTTGLVFASVPSAHAGFDWTPPASAPAKTMAMPSPTVRSLDNNGPLTPEPDAVPAAPVESVDASALPTPNNGVGQGGMKSLPPKSAVVQRTTPLDDMPAQQSDLPVPEKGAASVPTTPADSAPLVIDNTVPPSDTQPNTVTPTTTTRTAGTGVPVDAAPDMKPADTTASAPTTAPTTAPVTTAPATPSNDPNVVQGFGSDIPLALALRDIIPSGYAYIFGNSRVAGTKISWQGGKAWQDVLDAALAPTGLKATVEGKVVHIGVSSLVANPTPKSASASDAVPVPAPAPEMNAAPPVAAAPAPAPADKPLDLTSSDATPTAAPVPTTYSARDMVVDMNTNNRWQARPGSTLKEVLQVWAKTAHVDLQWVTPYDFPINNAFVYDGTFNEAVASLLAGYSRETPRPRGRLYPNAPDGPSVLMVN